MSDSLEDGARRYRVWPSLPAMFFDQAARLGDRPLLWTRRGGRYRALSWRETEKRVAALARALRGLGLGAGERVALASENRAEWTIADLAIMAAGCITVPSYATSTRQDHLHVLEDSGARAVIVSTRRLAERVLPAAQASARCTYVIAIEPPRVAQYTGVELVAWDDLLARGAGDAGDVAAWAREAGREDTACILYTSGTGGAPKGVMLSHGAILFNCMGAYRLLRPLGLENEVCLSFLPLSHSYEHTAGQFFPLSVGTQIYYAGGADKLAHDLRAARPTMMTAVPRLYETFRHRILHTIERKGAFTRHLFHRALELGRRAYEAPGTLSLAERVENRLLDLTVRRRVRAEFGGRLKAFVSGGAPLPYEVGIFFTALGVRILQGYGQTEAAPVVSCNPPHDNRIATVGPPLHGVEVTTADDGELLVRGELVMQGYWRDRAATEAALRDGWLHTGDIGRIDRDGYIRITDRKKDIIVNSGGDNVAPARVEGKLALQPEIAQAMVYGDRKPYLVAVLVPDADFVAAFAREHGRPADLGTLAAERAFRAALSEAVERVNAELGPPERVRRFLIAREPFTIDNATLTPTMKLRRHRIAALYGEALEALYGRAHAEAGQMR